MILPLEERFWAKVSRDFSGCWLWNGAHGGSSNGKYGRLYFKDGDRWTYRYAHTIAYEIHRGPLPAGTEIDHLCGNPACVNPWHLEAVPHTENLRRGNGPPAVNKRKTHCMRGHEFTPENTRLIRNLVTGRVDRRCRTCVRQYEKTYQRRDR